jgi:hypothetical protein
MTSLAALVTTVAGIVAFTAAPAAAASVGYSVSVAAGSASATLSNYKYPTTFDTSYRVTACDTKADGHHVEAWLLRVDGVLIKAKATGGNGTCASVSGVQAGCGNWFIFEVMIMEGSDVLQSKSIEKQGPECP